MSTSLIKPPTHTNAPCRTFNFISFFCATVCVALLLVVCGQPSLAQAEIKKSDIVLGQSIEARGLPGNVVPSIDSQYAILLDKEGTIFYERDAITPARIASMTKIMTAIVALEHMSLTDTVVVDHEAAFVGESSAALREGDTMDMHTALLALMVPSGNDAAIAIAKTVGAKLDPSSSDPQAVFIQAMNEKAAELGCYNTVYENPHGLDAGKFDAQQKSTAADTGRIIVYAMENPDFREVVSHGDTTITVTSASGDSRSIDLISTDELIGVYDGIAGIKTGFTDDAGYCFAGAVVRDEGEFYTVVMNAPSSTQRFTDTTTLMDWAFTHHVMYPLAHSPESTSMATTQGDVQVPVVARVAHNDWIDVTIPATLADPQQAVRVFDLAGNINQTAAFHKITGDIHVGDVLGTITFSQRNVPVAQADIIATEDVLAPSFFEGIKIWWNRLFKGINDEPTVASSVLINETPLLIDKTND